MFSVINGKDTSFSKFFKRQTIGEPHMRSIIKTACSDNGIVGIDQSYTIIMNCMRKTVTFILVEIGTPDTIISLLTRHFCVEIVKTYEDIGGNEGRRQKSAIFKGKSDAKAHKDVHGHAGPNKYSDKPSSYLPLLH